MTDKEFRELLARSSIGAGLRNIRENGIDAELRALDREMPAPKTAAERRRLGLK